MNVFSTNVPAYWCIVFLFEFQLFFFCCLLPDALHFFFAYYLLWCLSKFYDNVTNSKPDFGYLNFIGSKFFVFVFQLFPSSSLQNVMIFFWCNLMLVLTILTRQFRLVDIELINNTCSINVSHSYLMRKCHDDKWRLDNRFVSQEYLWYPIHAIMRMDRVNVRCVYVLT